MTESQVDPQALDFVARAEATEPGSVEEVIPEAMWPDLSKDRFTICGQEVLIKPLKVEYTLKLGQLLQPIIKGFGIDFRYIDDPQDPTQYIPIMLGMTEHMEIVPKVIELIAQNDKKRILESGGKLPNLAEIKDQGDEEGDMTFEDMLEATFALFTKNRKVGKPILDFFTSAIRRAHEDFSKSASLILQKQESTIKQTDSGEPEEMQAESPSPSMSS
jgi:hypothetical protein